MIADRLKQQHKHLGNKCWVSSIFGLSNNFIGLLGMSLKAVERLYASLLKKRGQTFLEWPVRKVGKWQLSSMTRKVLLKYLRRSKDLLRAGQCLKRFEDDVVLAVAMMSN